MAICIIGPIVGGLQNTDLQGYSPRHVFNVVVEARKRGPVPTNQTWALTRSLVSSISICKKGQQQPNEAQLALGRSEFSFWHRHGIVCWTIFKRRAKSQKSPAGDFDLLDTHHPTINHPTVHPIPSQPAVCLPKWKSSYGVRNRARSLECPAWKCLDKTPA